MAPLDLAARRMRAQRLAGPPFPGVAEAVRGLGAVQAQDWAGALWAVGLRTRRGEAEVEAAIEAREVVRTWPMRGTLHLVAAEDARWMLEHLAPRALGGARARLRQLGLDDPALMRRARRAVERALAGGRRLPRPAVYQALEDAGISTAGQRGIHVLWRLAHERLICTAGREDRQHAFALLDEWLPPSPALTRDEALAEVAARYFAGHGPASTLDLAWWAGLSAGDARRAVDLAGARLAREVVDGRELWCGRHRAAAPRRGAGVRGRVLLLPPFDEYLVGYRDRRPQLAPEDARGVRALLAPLLVEDGRVVGTWSRTARGGQVVVRAERFRPAGPGWGEALEDAVRAYGRFLGCPARVR